MNKKSGINDRNPKYFIREFAVGVASVLIVFWLLCPDQLVKADDSVESTTSTTESSQTFIVETSDEAVDLETEKIEDTNDSSTETVEVATDTVSVDEGSRQCRWGSTTMTLLCLVMLHQKQIPTSAQVLMLMRNNHN